MDQYKGVASMWQMALSSLYHLSSLAQEKLPSFNASEWALIYIYVKQNGLQWIVPSIFIFSAVQTTRWWIFITLLFSKAHKKDWSCYKHIRFISWIKYRFSVVSGHCHCFLVTSDSSGPSRFEALLNVLAFYFSLLHQVVFVVYVARDPMS